MARSDSAGDRAAEGAQGMVTFFLPLPLTAPLPRQARQIRAEDNGSIFTKLAIYSKYSRGNDPVCLHDPARAPGPGCRDYSTCLRDSASDPAQGSGATNDPACLSDPARALWPGRRDYSARLRDSASYPAQVLGTTYDPACLRDPAKASGPRRRDYSACLCDSAKGSGPKYLNYSESLSD